MEYENEMKQRKVLVEKGGRIASQFGKIIQSNLL